MSILAIFYRKNVSRVAALALCSVWRVALIWLCIRYCFGGRNALQFGRQEAQPRDIAPPQSNSIQQISHDVKSLFQHTIKARCRTEQLNCLTIFPWQFYFRYYTYKQCLNNACHFAKAVHTTPCCYTTWLLAVRLNKMHYRWPFFMPLNQWKKTIVNTVIKNTFSW